MQVRRLHWIRRSALHRQWRAVKSFGFIFFPSGRWSLTLFRRQLQAVLWKVWMRPFLLNLYGGRGLLVEDVYRVHDTFPSISWPERYSRHQFLAKMMLFFIRHRTQHRKLPSSSNINILVDCILTVFFISGCIQFLVRSSYLFWQRTRALLTPRMLSFSSIGYICIGYICIGMDIKTSATY